MADDEEELREYIRKLIKEESGGGGGGGSTDLGELGKLVKVAKDMKDAMTSEVDKALGTAVSEKIVNQVIPSMSPPPARASNSFWDTNSGVALMNKIGDQISPLADLIMNKIGTERTGKLVDGITNTYFGGQKNEDNMLLSWDPDNPSHMHQYMALRNLQDPNIARKMLIEEKNKAMNRMSSAGSGGGNGVSAEFAQTIESQNEMLRRLIQLREEDRKAMVQMYNTMEDLKKENEKIKSKLVEDNSKREADSSAKPAFDIDAIPDASITKKSVEGSEKSVEGSEKSVEGSEKSVEGEPLDNQPIMVKPYEPQNTPVKHVNEPVGTLSGAVVTNGLDSSKPENEPLIKPLNEPVEGSSNEPVNGSAELLTNAGEPVNDSNEPIKGADAKTEDRAVVSKRKGSPQWKE